MMLIQHCRHRLAKLWAMIVVKNRRLNWAFMAVFLTLLNLSTAGAQGASYLAEVCNASKETALIFVHGVLGDSTETWTSHRTGKYWPDLVCGDDRFNVDVYIYDFYSSLSGNQFSIGEIATNLGAHIAERGGFKDYKRVIFVAHSMGGLITRALLLRNQELAGKVHFLYFLAVPTTGASLAAFPKAFSRNPQFRQLMKMKPGTYLAEQAASWQNSIHLVKIPTFCAYEILPVEKRLIVLKRGLIVVEMGSAIALCNRQPVPALENHITIAKPENRKAAVYLGLLNAFKDTSKNAS